MHEVLIDTNSSATISQKGFVATLDVEE